MNKTVLFFLFVLITNSLNAQNIAKNYFEYHDEINKAEELFFIENKVDSSLFYYEKVFEKYDFIFVKDIVNAIQIAVYSKKPFEKYVELGFENGLKIQHLQNITILNTVYRQLEKNKIWKKKYAEKRETYLKKIDLKYLDWIYSIAIEDQINKYLPSKIYSEKLEKKILTLRDTILKKGFPGERIIGIQDSTIFKEKRRLPHLDITHRAKKNKKSVCFNEIDETEFSASIIIPMLLHIVCVTKMITKEELINQVKKGNIHPREIALFNDHSFIYKNNMASCCEGYKFEGFYFSSFGYSSKPIDIEKSNELRKKIHMCSYELDLKKKEFEKKFGFDFFSGYENYR